MSKANMILRVEYVIDDTQGNKDSFSEEAFELEIDNYKIRNAGPITGQLIMGLERPEADGQPAFVLHRSKSDLPLEFETPGSLVNVTPLALKIRYLTDIDDLPVATGFYPLGEEKLNPSPTDNTKWEYLLFKEGDSPPIYTLILIEDAGSSKTPRCQRLLNQGIDCQNPATLTKGERRVCRKYECMPSQQ